MVAHTLNNIDKIDKITIIGSDKIPSIGVGESTTMLFNNWMMNSLGLKGTETFNFIEDINAVIKYGVSYEGWSPKNFLHGFHNQRIESLSFNQFLTANKKIEEHANDYNSYVASFAYNNEIVMKVDDNLFTYQFEADSLITTLKNLAMKKNKINYKINTLKEIIYENEANQKIKLAILENGEIIEADYYINAIGSTAFNQNVFKEEYEWYDHILLTNKAIFTPIEYKDKEKEMHPYTVAKTMKHGWRWITPTWNRIGTGYVFSDKYCSVEDAKKELAEEIGEDLNFQVVDFTPRKVKQTFKENYCSIGMAAGFLEPLDAPGLSLTIREIRLLIRFFQEDSKKENIQQMNNSINFAFNNWAAFILLQYKTSHRDDTDFWKDHKNISFDFFEKLYSELYPSEKPKWERTMFINTMAGKDINWEIDTDELPKKLDTSNLFGISHYTIIELMREKPDILNNIFRKNLIKKRHNNIEWCASFFE